MTEKLCVFCNHLQYTGETGGEYSEPPNLDCAKRHYRKFKERFGDNDIYGLDDFRRMIVRAKDCPDYDEAKP